MDKKKDFFAIDTHDAPQMRINTLHSKNQKRVSERKKTSSFLTDCEKVLYHLTHYNFDYAGPHHNIGHNIVFIVGLPRAGKSTTERLLSGTDFFECFDELYSLSKMLGEITGPDGLEYTYPEYLPKMMDQIFPDMAQDFMTRLHEKTGDVDKIITNTMPGNYLYVPLLKKMLPNSKVIWCHRERPRHLAALYSKNFKRSYWNFTDDINELLDAYDLYYHVYDLYKSNMPDAFLDLQFEDTLNNPEMTLRKVMDFIAIDYTDATIETALAANQDEIATIRYIDDSIKKYLVYLPEFL